MRPGVFGQGASRIFVRRLRKAASPAFCCRRPSENDRFLASRVYARSVDPERARKLLSRERERITKDIRDLAPIESDEPTTTDQHMADQASDVYEAELDEGFSDDLRVELAAVERAEQRLAAGTYGLSIESGEPIPDERLEAEPTAERTAEEQARFER